MYTYRRIVGILAVMLLTALPGEGANDQAVQMIKDYGGKFRRDLTAPGQPIVDVDLSSASITQSDLKLLGTLKYLKRLSLGGDNTVMDLSVLASLNKLRVLNLSSAQMTRKGLQTLAGLRRLQELCLTDVAVDNIDLKEIGRMQQLRILWLVSVPVTDQGMRELSGLHKLRQLDLSNTKITDTGLKHLKNLKALRELLVDFTPVTDAGVNVLARQRQWKTLSLAGCKITDAGVAELGGQKELIGLDLATTDITDAAMPILSKLTQLTWLTLHHAPITDKGLQHLVTLKKLRNLDLGAGTFVSSKGVKNLKKALPQCRIEWAVPLVPPPAHHRIVWLHNAEEPCLHQQPWQLGYCWYLFRYTMRAPVTLIGRLNWPSNDWVEPSSEIPKRPRSRLFPLN